jgi:hypothetical protein
MVEMTEYYQSHSRTLNRDARRLKLRAYQKLGVSLTLFLLTPDIDFEHGQAVDANAWHNDYSSSVFWGNQNTSTPFPANLPPNTTAMLLNSQ